MKMHEILHSEYESRNNEIGNASPSTSWSSASTSESLSIRQASQNEKKSKEDLQCKICPYKGDDRKSIRIHNENHTYREGAIKCRYCLFYCYKKNNLLDHERLHVEFTAYNVGYTKKEHTKDLEGNKRKKINETLKVYGCSMCPYKSPNSEKLKIHTQRHDSKNFPENSFKCRICSYRTMSLTALEQHQYLHFKLQPVVMIKQESYSLNFSPIYLSTLKQYKSNQSNSPSASMHVSEQSNLISSSLYNTTEIIVNSIQSSTNLREKAILDSKNIVNGDESNSNSINNRQQSNERLSNCPHCPYRPMSADSLQRHIKRHIFEENYKRCKYRPYYSLNLKDIKRHEHKHELYMNRQLKAQICQNECDSVNPKLKRSKCELNSRTNQNVVETFNIEKNENIQIIKEFLNELIENIENESQ
jgi:hypothetical protein